MKQRLLRILSVLCILALACGCLTLSAFADDDVKLVTIKWDDDNNYDGLRPETDIGAIRRNRRRRRSAV